MQLRELSLTLLLVATVTQEMNAFAPVTSTSRTMVPVQSPPSKFRISSSFSATKSLSTEEEQQDTEDLPSNAYRRFLQTEEKRSMVTKSKIFEPLDAFEQELVIQSLELQILKANETLVIQGDQADGLYFLNSGSLVCYNEKENDGKYIYIQERGSLVGEMGLLLNEPRALSIRSNEDKTSVWKLPKDTFKKVFLSTSKTSVTEAAEFELKYPEHMNIRRRKNLMKKCPIYSQLSDDELNKIALSMEEINLRPGDQIIDQGAKGDEMYFVVEGSVECYDEKSKKVFKTCGKNDYFGELAFFLGRPRQLSVRAASEGKDVVLLKVHGSDFFESLLESSINEEAFRELSTRYQQSNAMFEGPSKLMKSLVVRSKPTKKPVSLHSTVGVLTAGVFLSFIFSNLSFQRYSNGLPEIFDFFSVLNARQANSIFFALMMFAVSGIMGIFRLPPKTPAIRKFGFMFAAITNLHVFLVGSSSLNLSSFYWYNAFSPLGKIVLGLSASLHFFMGLKFFHATIGADDNESASMPMMASIQGRAFTILQSFVFGSTFWYPITLLLTSNLVDFTTRVVQPLAKLKLSPFFMMGALTASATAGFGSLIATLQFEKKINKSRGAIILLLLNVLLSYDAAISARLIVSGMNEKLVSSINHFYFQSAQKTKYFEITVSFFFGTIAHGIYSRIKERRRQAGRSSISTA